MTPACFFPDGSFSRNEPHGEVPPCVANVEVLPCPVPCPVPCTILFTVPCPLGALLPLSLSLPAAGRSPSPVLAMLPSEGPALTDAADAIPPPSRPLLPSPLPPLSLLLALLLLLLLTVLLSLLTMLLMLPLPLPADKFGCVGGEDGDAEEAGEFLKAVGEEEGEMVSTCCLP